MKQYFCTNKGIAKKLLGRNLAHVGLVNSVCFNWKRISGQLKKTVYNT